MTLQHTPSTLLREKRRFAEACPAARQMRILELMKILCETPMTILEIEKELGTSDRTVYRYIALFNNLGFDIRVTDTGKYFFDKCPLCGK